MMEDTGSDFTMTFRQLSEASVQQLHRGGFTQVLNHVLTLTCFSPSLSDSPDFINIQKKSKCCIIFVKLAKLPLLCEQGFWCLLSLCRWRGLFMTSRPTSCSLIGRGCTCSGWPGEQDNVMSLLNIASLPQTYCLAGLDCTFCDLTFWSVFPDRKAIMTRIDGTGWRVSSSYHPISAQHMVYFSRNCSVSHT